MRVNHINCVCVCVRVCVCYSHCTQCITHPPTFSLADSTDSVRVSVHFSWSSFMVWVLLFLDWSDRLRQRLSSLLPIHCIHTRTHIRARTHTETRTPTHTDIDTRVHTHTHRHARTHTKIHMHTHARTHTTSSSVSLMLALWC